MNIFDHINKQAALTALLMVLALTAFFFYYLGGENSPESGISEVDGSLIGATLGKELLSALARLRSTKFDTAIFDDPVFMGLTDFGIEIAPQPVGRRNPFAVFEGRAVPAADRPSVGAAALSNRSPASGVSAPPKKPTPPVNSGGGFDLD